MRPMRGESRRYKLSSPKCSAADPRDRCWLRYCCHRPHQGGNPADDGPASGKVQKADPWQTVMISDRGDDQRRQVEAEHGAEHEIEADQIADAIDKAFHRLLSVRSAGGFPSHVREVGRYRAHYLIIPAKELILRANRAAPASPGSDAPAAAIASAGRRGATGQNRGEGE